MVNPTMIIYLITSISLDDGSTENGEHELFILMLMPVLQMTHNKILNNLIYQHFNT